MNKFINFKKILFSLFLLSFSFSPVFLMEDETTGSEPMEQESDLSQELIMDKKMLSILSQKPLIISPNSEIWRSYYKRKNQTDLISPNSKIWHSYYRIFGHIPPAEISISKDHWINFYNLFKHDICLNIEELNLDQTPENFLITDDVLFYIAKYFKNLKKLSSSFRGEITDNGIQSLIDNCPKLNYLRLVGYNSITEEMISQIQDRGIHFEGGNMSTRNILI